MNGLETLIDEFLSEDIKENPDSEYDDPEMRLTRFMHQMQQAGNDVSSWNEEDWEAALLKLGFDEDDIFAALENVASWGVVDNYDWESPTEQLLYRENG